MKLLRYQYFDTSNDTWIEGFEKKEPHIAIKDSDVIPSDYYEISGIEAWDRYGLSMMDYNQVRMQLIPLVISKASSDYSTWISNMTINQRMIAIRWLIAPYSLRVGVNGLVSDDVDKRNWKNLLEKTMGYSSQPLEGRAKCIEVMRLALGEEFRVETISKVDVDQFYHDTARDLDSYIFTNSPYFKWWLNNTVGSQYENNGFAQKSYYTVERKNILSEILSGNY